MKSVPKNPTIAVFNGGPKDGETIPYSFPPYPEYKAADRPAFNIGDWYTDSNPLPFQDVKWVRYELKKAGRLVVEPRKHIEINPAGFKDRYTVKLYELRHFDRAYVYQLEGSQDKPVVPQNAWFGRVTETKLINCFQNNNDDAYVAWVAEEEARSKWGTAMPKRGGAA